MSGTESAAGPASVDAVKFVRAAEIDWEAKATAARKAAAAELARLRGEAEAVVAAARAQAEQERARAVETARTSADVEAATIVTAGEVAAQREATATGRRPTDRRTEVLGAVLGDLAGS